MQYTIPRLLTHTSRMSAAHPAPAPTAAPAPASATRVRPSRGLNQQLYPKLRRALAQRDPSVHRHRQRAAGGQEALKRRAVPRLQPPQPVCRQEVAASPQHGDKVDGYVAQHLLRPQPARQHAKMQHQGLPGRGQQPQPRTRPRRGGWGGRRGCRCRCWWAGRRRRR